MNKDNYKTNPIDTGKIKRLSLKGWGIIEKENEEINIHYTIPGEIVKYGIVEQKLGKLWAKTISFKESSPYRVKPKCEHYGICGGCNLMHMEYKYQLHLKKKSFISIMENRLGHSIKIDGLHTAKPLNYRVKAKLKGIKETGKIGFIKKGKTDVMELNKCFLFHPKLNDFIRIWNNLESPPFIHQIDLFYNHYDRKTYAYLSHKPDDMSFREKFGENIVFISPTKNIFPFNVKIGKFRYKLLPEVFFQVNYLMWETLLNTVDKNLKKYFEKTENQLAIDLYCGVGFFTPLLKKYYETVIGVESSEKSVELAKESFPDIKFIRSSADKFSFPKGELIFVDPPRSGLGKKVLNKIIKKNYKKIFYLSCSYESLSDELRFFEKNQYEIKRVEIFDMFPHTPYLESLVILIKKNKS